MRHVSEVLHSKISNMDGPTQQEGRITGVPTGFLQLDRLLGCLRPGNLIIVGASPNLGTTTFALNLARSVARAATPRRVTFFSLGTDAIAVVNEFLSIEACIDYGRLSTGFISKIERELIRNTQKYLPHIPVFIEDTPGLSVQNIRAEAWRLKAQNGIDLVIIDPLHQIGGPFVSPDRRAVDDENSRLLKLLAEELDLPIVVLAHISTSAEMRIGKNRRPRLSDLREVCGADQFAEVVMLLYRAEYFSEKAGCQVNRGVMELAVLKHKNGPTGIIRLGIDPSTLRLVDRQPFAEPESTEDGECRDRRTW